MGEQEWGPSRHYRFPSPLPLWASWGRGKERASGGGEDERRIPGSCREAGLPAGKLAQDSGVWQPTHLPYFHAFLRLQGGFSPLSRLLPPYPGGSPALSRPCNEIIESFTKFDGM